MIGAYVEEEGPLAPRLVVILPGLPCAWGRCVFCPFKAEASTSLGELLEATRRVVGEAEELLRRVGGVDRVALYCGSSVSELPLTVLRMASRLTRGRIVDVEERPEYVTVEELEALMRILGAGRLVVRVGVESWFPWVREALGKGIPQEEVVRVPKLIRRARELGVPVEAWAYVLFGIEGVPEWTVERSVVELRRLYDAVVCVRYRRLLPGLPREVRVSEELRRRLEELCTYVDWGEGPQWEVSSQLH